MSSAGCIKTTISKVELLFFYPAVKLLSAAFSFFTATISFHSYVIRIQYVIADTRGNSHRGLPSPSFDTVYVYTVLCIILSRICQEKRRKRSRCCVVTIVSIYRRCTEDSAKSHCVFTRRERLFVYTYSDLLVLVDVVLTTTS